MLDNRFSYFAALLICLAAIGQPLRLFAEQKDSEKITFRHEPHREGAAEKFIQVVSQDGRVVARVIGERKCDVRLFDAKNDSALGPVIELQAHRITALAIHPDNCTIATAIGNFSNDWGEVRVWNGKTGIEIAKYTASPAEGLPHLGEVFRLVFSEDGKKLTVVSGPTGGK